MAQSPFNKVKKSYRKKNTFPTPSHVQHMHAFSHMGIKNFLKGSATIVVFFWSQVCDSTFENEKINA